MVDPMLKLQGSPVVRPKPREFSPSARNPDLVDVARGRGALLGLNKATFERRLVDGQ